MPKLRLRITESDYKLNNRPRVSDIWLSVSDIKSAWPTFGQFYVLTLNRYKTLKNHK